MSPVKVIAFAVVILGVNALSKFNNSDPKAQLISNLTFAKFETVRNTTEGVKTTAIDKHLYRKYRRTQIASYVFYSTTFFLGIMFILLAIMVPQRRKLIRRHVS